MHKSPEKTITLSSVFTLFDRNVQQLSSEAHAAGCGSMLPLNRNDPA
jgi:hypothetical protein